MDKCYKCGKDAAPGRFIKVNDCWTQEGFHWYAACEECYCKEMYKGKEPPKKMVKKVKMVSDISIKNFERAVNEAIRDLDVIDIKYNNITAMIIYQEEE